MWQEFPFAADEISCQKTSMSFVDSVWEIFGPLLQGVPSVIIPNEVVKDPRRFVSAIRDEQITRIVLVPSLLRALLESEDFGQTAGIRYWATSGEVLPGDLLKTFQEALPQAALINLYGCTEAAGDSSFLDTRGTTSFASVPIGRPIANTEIHLLDSHLRQVPVGVTGEIYIGGAGVARGYLNRPDLSAKSFLPNPFGGEKGTLLYKTGDLARYLPDGNIEYLGRADQQVKVRGFRIELNEIESAICEVAPVRQAIVVAREDIPGDIRLLAYLIALDAQTLSLDELREQLNRKLPGYMVPSTFVLLSGVPLTSTGKIDRKALPSPDAEVLASERRFVAPRTRLEETLCDIWTETLGISKIGVTESFFDLGGHSLLAIRIISKVRAALGIEIPPSQIFEKPTIQEFAKAVELKKQTVGSQRPPIVPGALADRVTDSTQIDSKDSELFPMSFAQQQLWVVDQLHSAGAAYNIPLAIHFEGELDVRALASSLDEIVRRHESLRTVFRFARGEPRQIVFPPTPVLLPTDDLSDLPETARHGERERITAEESQHSFDLADGPLFRTRLLRCGDRDHTLLFVVHHIAFDYFSIAVLVRDFTELYGSFHLGKKSVLPALSIQYPDFAVWQREWLQGSVLERHVDYWKRQLEGAPASFEICTDHPRGIEKTYSGAWLTGNLPLRLLDSLESLRRREGVSLFIALLASFETLLYRHTGQEVVLIGSTTAGRDEPCLENLIGYFVNPLVLRTDLSGNPTFREVLRRVRKTAVEAYDFQDLPFEKLVKELRIEPDPSRNPLFQLMFLFQEIPMGSKKLGDLRFQWEGIENHRAKFDLTAYLERRENGLLVIFEYNTDLFEESTIRRLMDRYRALIEAVVANPDRGIDELPILTDADRRQLVVDFNDTAVEFAEKDDSLHQFIENQVDRTPEKLALVFEQERLTYTELNARANQLAHYLSKRGVGPDVLVGVCVERSIEMVVGLLGVLKAGGAYVPLDPGMPNERLSGVIKDSGVKVIVTTRAARNRLQGVSSELIDLNSDWARISEEPGTPCSSAESFNPDHLAYVIYTSGSTGRPKGVCISHRALVNFLCSMQRCPGFSENEVLLAVTTVSFDIAGLELYLPLVSGARCVIATKETALDGRKLARLIEDSGATVMQATPATWRLLLESGWQGKKDLKVLCGGEAMPKELAQQLLPMVASLWNMYGPTETTIWSTVQAITTGSGDCFDRAAHREYSNLRTR